MIEGFKFFSGTRAIRGKRPADRQHYTFVTVALVGRAGLLLSLSIVILDQYFPGATRRPDAR